MKKTYITGDFNDADYGNVLIEVDDSDFEEIVKIFKKNNLKEDKDVALKTYYEISRYLREAGYKPNKK